MPKKRLPIAPSLISRVMQAAADDNVSAADLSRLISSDPGLSAEVLRAVNSAFYGLARSVTSVQQAVALLGLRSVRNLVLCLAMQQLAPPGALTDFPLETFTECSLRRASAAQALARRVTDASADDLFTLSLCQDVGITIQLQRDPSLAARFAELLRQPAAVRLAAERELGEGHDQVGAALFKEWKLPETFVAAIRHHHDPESAPPRVQLDCRIALAAEAIADLLFVEDKAEALQVAREHLDELNIKDSLESIIDEVAAEVAKAGELLQVPVGVQPSFAEIVAQAGQALFALQATAHGEAALLEQALARQEQRAQKLEREAGTDELTGLPNRRTLFDTLTRELAQAERQQTHLSVVMVDVDHFKRFNDTHGHQAGDLVLREVANVLREGVRRGDLAARYGGEEFAVLLPFTDVEGGLLVAERLREGIASLRVLWQGEELRVTASFGGATVTGSAARDALEQTIQVADQALYQAKHEGRNRTCWAMSDESRAAASSAA